MGKLPGEGKADFEAIAQSLADGAEPLSAAYEHGFNAIAFDMRCFEGAPLKSLASMSRAEAMDALDSIKSGANHLRHVAPIFAKYPGVAKAIDNAWLAMFYAESFMTPFLMLGNADAVDKTGLVNTYIARNPDTGLIKIGRAIDVEQRLRALGCGAAATLQLLAEFPGDSETALHRRFSQYRHHGEWFLDADGVIAQFAERGGDQ